MRTEEKNVLNCFYSVSFSSAPLFPNMDAMVFVVNASKVLQFNNLKLNSAWNNTVEMRKRCEIKCEKRGKVGKRKSEKIRQSHLLNTHEKRMNERMLYFLFESSYFCSFRFFLHISWTHRSSSMKEIETKTTEKKEREMTLLSVVIKINSNNTME